MNFRPFKRKLIGIKDFHSLEDILNHLKKSISKLNQDLQQSITSEKNYQEKYSIELSKLNYQGSREAIEFSRAELSRSLDLEVMIEFLMTCQNIIKKIPSETFEMSKKDLSDLTYQILDLDNIQHQTTRRSLLRKLKKYITNQKLDPEDLGSINGKISESEVNDILTEIETTESEKIDIDNEVDKIINDLRKKSF